MSGNLLTPSTFLTCCSPKIRTVPRVQTKAIDDPWEKVGQSTNNNRMKDGIALNWPFKAHIISGLHFLMVGDNPDFF